VVPTIVNALYLSLSFNTLAHFVYETLYLSLAFNEMVLAVDDMHRSSWRRRRGAVLITRRIRRG